MDREAFPNLLTIDLVDDTTVKVKDTVEVEVKDNTFETEVKKLMEDKTMDPVEKEDKLQKASDMKKEKVRNDKLVCGFSITAIFDFWKLTFVHSIQCSITINKMC